MVNLSRKERTAVYHFVHVVHEMSPDVKGGCKVALLEDSWGRLH